MPSATDRQTAISLIRAVHHHDTIGATGALDHHDPAQLCLAVVGHLLYLAHDSDVDVDVWLDELAVLHLQADDDRPDR